MAIYQYLRTKQVWSIQLKAVLLHADYIQTISQSSAKAVFGHIVMQAQRLFS